MMAGLQQKDDKNAVKITVAIIPAGD